MATERYDIEINDKINSNVAKKLNDIAKGARDANTAIENLKKSLGNLDPQKVIALTKAQNDEAKAAAAAALQEQKLAQALAKTSEAQGKAAVASAKATTEQTKATVASKKAEQADLQLEASRKRVSAANNQIVISEQKAAVATAKASTAQSKAASAAAQAGTAQQKLAQSIARTTVTQNQAAASIARTGTAQNNLARSAASLQGVQTNANKSTVLFARSQEQLRQSTTQANTALIKQQQAMVQLQRQQLALQKSQNASSREPAGTGYLFGIGAGALSVGLTKEIAAYENLNNRIRVATDGTEQFNRVQAALYKISQDTYTSMSSNALVFQRFAPIAGKLGKTEEDLFEVLTNINKALAISGSTAEEARGALIQLSQAAGGDFKTSAQEMNSLLEQAPGIAKTLADQLGTTTDQIKAFGKAGKISTKDFFDAFSEGGKGVDELRKRFGALQVSITQFGQQFANALTLGIGKMSEATGLATAMGKAIQFATGNIEALGIGAAAVFPILIGGFVSSEIAAAAFNKTILANPLILGASFLAAVITALTTMNDKINGAGDSVAKFQIRYDDFILAALAGTEKLARAWDFLFDTNYAASIQQDFNAVFDERQQLIEDTLKAEDKYHQSLQKSNSDLGEQEHKLSSSAKAAGDLADAIDKTGSSGKAAGNTISKSFDDVTKSINAASNAFLTLNQELANYNARGGAKVIDVNRSLQQQGVGGTVVVGSKPINSITGEEYSNLATGGRVRGPGGPKDDMIPAMLSNGEFVVNAAATTKYGRLLNAINKSPIHMADGGFVNVGNSYGNTQKVYTENTDMRGPLPTSSGSPDYSPSNYSPSSYLGTGSEPLQGGTFSLGGSELDALLASGLEPYIGYNGASGGWKFTGNYSPEVIASYQQQSADIASWTAELQDWLSNTLPTLTDAKVRSDVQDITQAWINGLPNYTIDPRPYVPGPPIGAKLNPAYDMLQYHFEDVTSKFLSAGYAAAILSTAGPWSQTLGNYVTYSGPSYGGTIAYGGDPGEAQSYLLTKDDVAKAMVSSFSPGSSPTSSASLSSEDALAQFFGGTQYAGAFASGGSYVVGGDGGQDSQLVTLLATPGETITVNTPNEPGGTNIQSMFGQGAIVIAPQGNPEEWKRSEDQVIFDLTKKIFDMAAKRGMLR